MAPLSRNESGRFGALKYLSVKIKSGSPYILDSKTNSKYYFKHVQFHFSDRITYNLWEKTKVETLSLGTHRNIPKQILEKTENM
jgi:hypothetical protein